METMKTSAIGKYHCYPYHISPCNNSIPPNRQLVHAGQPQLSEDQRALVWSWILRDKDPNTHEVRDSDSPLSDEEGPLAVRELWERVTAPTVFDSLSEW